MPTKRARSAPAYLISSVDHALRLCTILQLEGSLTVTDAAARLDVAPSTAHRLLATLVYRDFAAHEEGGRYDVGPVLAVAVSARSDIAALRDAALGPLESLAEVVDETASLIIRTGDTARFIAAVESRQVLRVTSREGMVFPAHQVTGGLLLLAMLSDREITALYAKHRYGGRQTARPQIRQLIADIAEIRRSGLAINLERSERGVAAVGRAVLDTKGRAVAGVSVSMPTVRYSQRRLPAIDRALRHAAADITARLSG